MATRPHRRRILLFTLGGALALVAFAWLILPLIVAPILRGKLRSLVSNHLRADLHLADLSYRFPYTVSVTDARIVFRDEPHAGHELLRLGRGRLTLDQLPLGAGPLRIRSIELDRPTLHVVRDPTGAVVGHDVLLREDEAPKLERRMKLSDLFRLRNLTLRGGKVVFEDRARPDAPLMVWDNLTTDLGIAPREQAVYDFRYRAGGAPLAELSAEGSIDIDRLVLVVDRLALTGRANPDADFSSVPAVVHEFVRKHRIAGAARVEGGGTVPLRDPQAVSFEASVDLVDARAHVYRYDRTLDRLDLRIELAKESGARAIDVRVRQLDARAETAQVTLADARGAVDWAAQTWRLSVPQARAHFSGASSQPATLPASDGSIALALDVAGSLDRGRIHWDRSSGRATLDDVTLRLPRFERPLEHVSGSVTLDGGAAVVERLSATYGGDVWTVAAARVGLTHLPDRFDVTDVAAAAHFALPTAVYPTGFGKVVAALRPTGLFSITGGFSRDRAAVSGPRALWDFIVASDGGAFTLTGRDIALTSIRGEAHVTRREIEIRRFLANVFDGALAATGTIDPRKPVSYRGEVSAENVDLRALVEHLRGPSGESKFTTTGRLGGTATLDSQGGSLEMLRAAGELVVHDGVLWEVPVLSDVVGQTKVARDKLSAGEAAAVLEMRDGVVHVRHAAVSSPALGLQGWGTIELRDGGGDRALNLGIVAAPLGDWEQHLKRTNVPIVSDVVGAVAGAMQKALNTATSTLLYEFRVTGPLTKPQLAAVPTPVLTEAAAFVFEGMLRREKDLMKPIRQRGRRDGTDETSPRRK